MEVLRRYKHEQMYLSACMCEYITVLYIYIYIYIYAHKLYVCISWKHRTTNWINKQLYLLISFCLTVCKYVCLPVCACARVCIIAYVCIYLFSHMKIFWRMCRRFANIVLRVLSCFKITTTDHVFFCFFSKEEIVTMIRGINKITVLLRGYPVGIKALMCEEEVVK